jgi:cysteinyl-tRNA synthetase
MLLAIFFTIVSMLDYFKKASALLGFTKKADVEDVEKYDYMSMADSAREEAFGKVVDMLLEQRQAAKAAKDWATSDKIRNELQALGFEIKDGKEGVTWKLNK